MLSELNTSEDWWRRYGKYVFRVLRYEKLVIMNAHGCTLRDVEGKEYLDLGIGFAQLLGYDDPLLIEAIISTARKMVYHHHTLMSPIVFEACKKIADVTPRNLKKVMLLSTGSEANEFAFRLAKTYTDGYEMIGVHGGYSGITLATYSVSGLGPQVGSVPLVPGSHSSIISPYCYRCPLKLTYPHCNFLCLDVSRLILMHAIKGKVAAFMIEPIFSGGGIIVPPPGYFNRLMEIVHDYNALLVVDEAHTAFGRTGKWFGIEHYDITPDILTTCKGMGGGVPISGVVTTLNVEEECVKKGLYHGSTHQYNPLPAAAVSAVIDAIKSEKLVDAAKRKGEYFMKRLKELQESYPAIGDVRGKGLMIGVELVKPKTKEHQPDIELSKTVRISCLRRGLLLGWLSTKRPAIFRIEPPLVIKMEEIDKAIETFEASLKEALRNQT